jgi:hypothetical protein
LSAALAAALAADDAATAGLDEIADAQTTIDRAYDALAAAVRDRDATIARLVAAGVVRQADAARVAGLSRGRVSQIVAAAADQC